MRIDQYYSRLLASGRRSVPTRDEALRDLERARQARTPR